MVTINDLCGVVDKDKKDCNVGLVEFLLRKGAGLNDSGFKYFPPIHYAIRRDNKPVIKLLCEYGAKPTTKDLCDAIDKKDCDIGLVELLLKKGARHNDPEHKGYTPMKCAKESFYSKNEKNKTCLNLIHDRAISYSEGTKERVHLRDSENLY